MIPKTARNQDTIQRNAPYAAKITPRITKDVRSTKILVATRSHHTRVNNLYQRHSATYPNQQRPLTIPTTSNTQPHHSKSLHTNTPVQPGKHTYAQILKNNQTPVLEPPTLAEQLATSLNEFKTMFSKLISQTSTILNLLATVISKFNP